MTGTIAPSDPLDGWEHDAGGWGPAGPSYTITGFDSSGHVVLGPEITQSRRARRRSKGWRKHVRRVKAADRSGL